MEDEEEGQRGWNGTHSTEGISREEDFAIVEAYLLAIGMTKNEAGACEAKTSACEGAVSACKGDEESACEGDGGTLTGRDEDVVGGKRRKT